MDYMSPSQQWTDKNFQFKTVYFLTLKIKLKIDFDAFTTTYLNQCVTLTLTFDLQNTIR